MNTELSNSAFEYAQTIIPGGVNSPVRAFKSVGRNPIVIAKAKGSKIWDIDGNSYIDYVSSWGPMILGHAYAPIIEAIQKQAELGTSYGAPTLLENQMAELVCSMFPSIEMVRMVNSGTEATMSAIRLARGYTQKTKIVKFSGCYHGHGDSFLIKAGSGAMTFGTPNSPGVTESTAKDTLIADYNDIASVEALFAEYGNDIAAIIVEPVAANMGLVLPQNNFLQQLRDITTKHNSLLIFDEVITGFRLAPGGAQEFFNVMPDLTTLGKILGGGLPVGAYGGKKEIMQQLAPVGPVYQAGTLSGNPLAMSAGIVMLKTLQSQPEIYTSLTKKTEQLVSGLRKGLEKEGIPAVINTIGSLATLYFTKNKEVISFNDVMTSDTEMYGKYFRASLEAGIYLAPSQFEAAFMSNAHTNEDIEFTILKSEEAFKQLHI